MKILAMGHQSSKTREKIRKHADEVEGPTQRHHVSSKSWLRSRRKMTYFLHSFSTAHPLLVTQCSFFNTVAFNPDCIFNMLFIPLKNVSACALPMIN
jgi:hypothetical protein